MYLWIELIKTLMERGYTLEGTSRKMKLASYPICEFQGSIPEGTSPLLYIYELMSVVEVHGGKHTTKQGKCVVDMYSKSHIDWLEQIGSPSLPSDMAIEVNLLEGESMDFSLGITRGFIECYVSVSQKGTYKGKLEIILDELLPQKEPKAVLIWECEYDDVLNKGLKGLVSNYFRVVESLSAHEELTESESNLVMKLDCMNYVSRTISVKRKSLGEESFSEVLIGELDKYLMQGYDKTLKV